MKTFQEFLSEAVKIPNTLDSEDAESVLDDLLSIVENGALKKFAQTTDKNFGTKMQQRLAAVVREVHNLRDEFFKAE